MLVEPGEGFVPHGLGQDMPYVRLNEVAEVLCCAGPGIGLGDGLHARTDLLNGTTPVLFSEVHMQRTRCDQGGNIRRVAVLQEPGDEVGKAVQELGAMDCAVGG